MRFVIIPVKELSKAKERLSSILNAEQRRHLAKAMLTDVLSSVKKSIYVNKIYILTSDNDVINLASEMQVDVIVEDSQSSESDSVDRGSNKCIELGAKTIITIPGDAPLIRAEDIDDIFEHEMQNPSIILVPSRDENGTNALLRKPPDLIPSRFGIDSFRKHIGESLKKNLPYKIIRNDRIALDIDHPSDLRILIKEITNNKQSMTYNELARMGFLNGDIF